MITYAEISDIPALKTMWALCFADTPEFIEFYFDNIFRPDEMPVYYSDGIPAAALQLIPYQIKLSNSVYPAGYISGAMTHPDYRKQGLMKQLLLFSFEEMKRQHIPLSFLIPQEKWLFDFYGKLGYRRAFPKTIETVPVSGNDSSGVVQGFPPECSSLYPFYHSFLSRQENAVLKTPAQFEVLLKDLYLEGGGVFTVDAGKRGIALAVPGADSVLIKELFYDCETTRHQLFCAVQKAFQPKTVQCVFRHSREENHLFGMVKIIDETLFPVGLPDIYMSMMLD